MTSNGVRKCLKVNIKDNNCLEEGYTFYDKFRLKD